MDVKGDVRPRVPHMRATQSSKIYVETVRGNGLPVIDCGPASIPPYLSVSARNELFMGAGEGVVDAKHRLVFQTLRRQP